MKRSGPWYGNPWHLKLVCMKMSNSVSQCSHVRVCFDAGKMYIHCIVPLAFGSIGLVILALTLDHHKNWALFGLTLSATSQASNPLEWGYPATYLHGYGLTMGWAIANCISGFGGALPYSFLLPFCPRCNFNTLLKGIHGSISVWYQFSRSTSCSSLSSECWAPFYCMHLQTADCWNYEKAFSRI